MSLNTLKQQIEAVRQQMVKTGMEKGFTHPETVKLSQQLDKLLNQVQRTK